MEFMKSGKHFCETDRKFKYHKKIIAFNAAMSKFSQLKFIVNENKVVYKMKLTKKEYRAYNKPDQIQALNIIFY